jgi:hypothetical protein
MAAIAAPKFSQRSPGEPAPRFSLSLRNNVSIPYAYETPYAYGWKSNVECRIRRKSLQEISNLQQHRSSESTTLE